jgi:hypothetical protein
LYGDPLALAIYTKTGPNFSPQAMMDLRGWTMADYLRNVAVRSFATFWYFLHPNQIKPAPVLFLLVLVIGLGGLLGTLRWLRDDRAGEPGQRRVVGLYLLAPVLLAPFFARFVLTVFQAQGRYFLPVLLPIALVTCLGWATLAAGRDGETGKPDGRRVGRARGAGRAAAARPVRPQPRRIRCITQGRAANRCFAALARRRPPKVNFSF